MEGCLLDLKRAEKGERKLIDGRGPGAEEAKEEGSGGSFVGGDVKSL